MRPEEIRDKTEQEQQELLREKREALSNLRFKRVTDVIEDPSKFEKTKRDIARILTIMNEDEASDEKEIEA